MNNASFFIVNNRIRVDGINGFCWVTTWIGSHDIKEYGSPGKNESEGNTMRMARDAEYYYRFVWTSFIHYTNQLNLLINKLSIKSKVAVHLNIIRRVIKKESIGYMANGFNVTDISIYLSIYLRGAFNKFPDFIRMGTFIDSTHMKL